MKNLKSATFLKKAFLLFLIAMTGLMPMSCSKENMEDYPFPSMPLSDFPTLDCSTSTQPLSVILASKILRLPYQWWQDQAVTQVWYVSIDWERTSLTETQRDILKSKLNCSTTHGAYMNLLDRKVDLIITSRDISRDEQRYADSKNIKLITRPIGRDGFIFIVNKNNPITSLSIKQIQDIYTDKIGNWKDVGGKDATINPYVRNANSGSQEKMETMVMKGLTIVGKPGMETGTMAGPFYEIRKDVNGIAYTPFYYYNIMARGQNYAKAIGINGILPDKESINNGTYPYVSEIFASIKADTEHDSYAYKLFEYLTQKRGQSIVEESGYVPLTSTMNTEALQY